MSKTVRVLQDYDHWVTSQSLVAYKTGQELKVPDLHADAGVKAGAFEVVKDAAQAEPLGHKPSAKV
jgi:hypothetical protein